MRNFKKHNFKGQKALVRVDFNVPLNDKLKVNDNTRIMAALPTIHKILKDGGSVVLMSHLGRPKGKKSKAFSLKNILNELCILLERKIQFVPATVGALVKKSIASMEMGDVLVLENLRFDPREKAGDEDFAKQLAELGCDVYVNDAFGTAHRAHASTAIVAKFFPKKNIMPGALMTAEVQSAKNVLENKAKPFTAILGGAKVSDKIQLIENLLDKADNILIGGAMAYTFFKAKGGKVGKSLVEEEHLKLASTLLAKAKKKGVKILLPKDSVAADDFNAKAKTKIQDSDKISKGWMGLDIGPKAVNDYKKIILKSKIILWNGPMGVFEMDAFSNGTKEIALAVGEATKKNGAFSLVGGGDSVSAVKKLELQDQISYISTGGGAMLEFFEGKELPGIKSLS